MNYKTYKVDNFEMENRQSKMIDVVKKVLSGQIFFCDEEQIQQKYNFFPCFNRNSTTARSMIERHVIVTTVQKFPFTYSTEFRVWLYNKIPHEVHKMNRVISRSALQFI